MSKSPDPRSKKIRLQKFLAEGGVASRRRAEELILEGRVKVNGAVVRVLGTTVDPSTDEVEVDKKRIKIVEKGILLLHKPLGVISSKGDPHGRPSLSQYLTAKYQSYFPVGRLDWDSSGLMILTNDGELAERLLHPRYEYERCYEVKVEGAVTPREAAKIERGVQLEDGIAKARIQILGTEKDETVLEVIIKEGRNRIVRRMMDAVGHPVRALKRLSHGPFKLGRLKVGEVSRLSEREYRIFRERVLKKES